MAENPVYLKHFTSGKVSEVSERLATDIPDSLEAWIKRYLALAVTGVRSDAVTRKISLHLGRFLAFFKDAYGHDRISACLRRDVLAWQSLLRDKPLAPATVNNHLASLSAFTTWVATQDPYVFSVGDPAKGISELPLPPLEPKALDERQVRPLKNLCDRLERFHGLKNRRCTKREGPPPLKKHARPKRDRAIVFVLLATGLRREELVLLGVHQVEPKDPITLRTARRARIRNVKGKGGTERTVFLSADARAAVADYLELERPKDVGKGTTALFLSATGLPTRSEGGSLSTRSVNHILEQIGRWHDAEITDPARHISPLRPHDLRHTFAFQLAKETGADDYELERRLGHRSGRYIQRYTNPPEHVAARLCRRILTWTSGLLRSSPMSRGMKRWGASM